jgi:hypothetical protein
MIYKLMKLCLSSSANKRITKCSKARVSYYGCKSIRKLEIGTQLGLDKRATI